MKFRYHIQAMRLKNINDFLRGRGIYSHKITIQTSRVPEGFLMYMSVDLIFQREFEMSSSYCVLNAYPLKILENRTQISGIKKTPIETL